MRAQERLWRTEDGERLVRDGDPAARFLAYATGDEIAKADEGKVPCDPEVDEQPPKGEESFDPSEYTVQEVLDHLEAADAEETLRVLDAEVAGQARKGILDRRDAILHSKEGSDPEPTPEPEPDPKPEAKAKSAPANKARSKPADK